MTTMTEPSPLAVLAARLTTGTTATQIAAELEEAAEATLAQYREMAPFWAARTAALGAVERERGAAAERAMDFLAREMFPAAPPTASVAEKAAPVEAVDMAETAVGPTMKAAAAASPSGTQTTVSAVTTSNRDVPVTTAAPVASGTAVVVEVHHAGPQSSVVPALATPHAATLEKPFFIHRATMADATHQVMGQERGTLRRFREDRGDRPVDSYSRGDITGFLNTLRRCPTSYGKSPRDKDRSLADIIAEANETGADRLKDKTVKRHLSTLSRFFWFAFDQGYISEAQWKTLVAHHAFRDEEGAREQREAWRSEELVKLFGSPVWTGCNRYFRTQAGPCIIPDAKFWLPLLALYHGARLEEFADLYGRDFGCDDGTWFINIRESEERRRKKRMPDGRKVEGRRLKNDNAQRVVPLHPELVRLGFPEYVEAKAPAPDMPLFPDIAPQGKDGKRGPRITRWFSEYRKAIGTFRSGVGMHAFRHTANTRLRDAMRNRQDERIINYMLGHSAGGGEGELRYDKGPGLKAAVETLALLRYPELDLRRPNAAA